MDAVKSFEMAHRLDPSLAAMERIESVVRWVSRVQDLIQRKVSHHAIYFSHNHL